MRIWGIVVLAVILVDQLYDALHAGLVSDPEMAVGTGPLPGPAPWSEVFQLWLFPILFYVGWLILIASARSRRGSDSDSGAGASLVQGAVVSDAGDLEHAVSR